MEIISLKLVVFSQLMNSDMKKYSEIKSADTWKGQRDRDRGKLIETGRKRRQRKEMNRNILIWNKQKLIIFGNVSDTTIFTYCLTVDLQTTSRAQSQLSSRDQINRLVYFSSSHSFKPVHSLS